MTNAGGTSPRCTKRRLQALAGGLSVLLSGMAAALAQTPTATVPTAGAAAGAPSPLVQSPPPSVTTTQNQPVPPQTAVLAASRAQPNGFTLVDPSLEAASRASPVETPDLAAAVAAGTLPPVVQRLPTDPARVFGTGVPGGELRTLMSSDKDTRLMVVYGYARLVAYAPSLEIVPDIAERVEVVENRIFTFHLRPGHRWSDGSPFTSEDFRYFWEDVANNPQLSPTGPPQPLLVDHEKPTVEYPDATTIRYSWSKPNPTFLGNLAGSMPLLIYRPSHYLRQFHSRYADKEILDKQVKQAGVRNWAELHNRRDHMYHNDNPDIPTLQPWTLVTKPPSERFVFRRNPFYYRVDEAGHQLPYIDQIVMSIADAKIIPAKTGAGEADLQARFLRFDNYTFLKAAEHRNDFKVHLWSTAKGSHMTLYPNLNAHDPVWRRLLRDVRFRRALSLGIDRHEINEVIFYGLGIEGQNTALPQSAVFQKAFQEAFAGYDIGQANRLLDEIGLTSRDDRGVRLLPDGRPIEIVVENTGQSAEQADALELIRDSWAEIGVAVDGKAEQAEVMRQRIFSGATIMTLDEGFDDGMPTPDTSPSELAPVQQEAWQWPAWGAYAETAGHAGSAPDMPGPLELLHLYQSWGATTDRQERTRIWTRMLAINADQLYTIGIVSAVPQPVVVSNRLHNVPDQGIYSWQPGAQMGIYKPDRFWMSPPAEGSSREQASDGSKPAARPPLSSLP